MYVYRQYSPVFIMIEDAWVIVLYIGVDVFIVWVVGDGRRMSVLLQCMSVCRAIVYECSSYYKCS